MSTRLAGGSIRRRVLAVVAASVVFAGTGVSVGSATEGCKDDDSRGGAQLDKCSKPDLRITKTGPANVKFGETATYMIVVRNVGKGKVTKKSIRVTDPAVTDEELVFASVVQGDADKWLETGEAWEYRRPGPGKPSVAITPSTCDPVTNTAFVKRLKPKKDDDDDDDDSKFVGKGFKPVDHNSSTVTTAVICVPDLALSKTADKASYRPGDSITYTVTVTNVGPIAVPFASIAVSDPTLPGLALAGDPPASLEPGKSLTYTASRTATTADCGTISNVARVALAGAVPEERSRPMLSEENLSNNSAQATVAVVCESGLSITKSADATVYAPGQMITYTVVVRNTGQTAIPFGQIAVSDPKVANLALVGAAPSSLAPGATLTYTGTRVAAVADCGTLGNTATVTVSTPVPLTASAAVTVTIAGGACLPPDLSASLQIRKTGPTAARARSAFLHSMRVTNTGFVTARNVVVEDPVPRGLAVAARPADATIVKGVVRWELGDLGPGESRTVSVALTTTFRGVATRCNVATADADNAAPVTSRLCTRFAGVAGATFVPPRVTG